MLLENCCHKKELKGAEKRGRKGGKEGRRWSVKITSERVDRRRRTHKQTMRRRYKYNHALPDSRARERLPCV